MSDWSDVNDEGVRLAVEGDVVGARAALEQALAAAPPGDRAQVLVNLAHLSDEHQHAVDLLTEAIALSGGRTRVIAIASRADLLPWLERWEEAWQDVDTALADADPPDQVVLRTTRVGLLIRADRLAEAEADALDLVELASSHAPEYLENIYTNLALLADEAGDERRASMYRVLSDNPGRQPLGPRWLRFAELNTEGAVLLTSGDRAGAKAAFTAAYHEVIKTSDLAGTIRTGVPLAGTSAQQPPAETPTPQPDGSPARQHQAGDAEPTTDVEALVCRAGVAGNLAGVADHPEEAVRWSTEAVEAARGALALVGDAYGSATVLVNALISRAAARQAQTRHPEALKDLDDALEVVASAEGGESFEATIRATRARVLATGGWFAEAAEEGRVALDLTYAAAPELAASVHLTLAEVTSATGDLPGAAEHLGLARDLSAATGDVDGETTALLSSARLAYLASDVDRADALYDEAEALIADDPNRLLACLNGRAAVEVLRGRPHDALRWSDRALALLPTTTFPLATLAVRQVRGSALESAGRFAEAEDCYAEASARCEEAGLWHVALGMAWWRADALVRRAAATTGDERRQLGRQALDLALPAALASEAVRRRFPHGPLRERWVALASAPATRSAFLAIRAVGDTALAAEYIDHIAGAVSLHAESTAPVERAELISLPAPPPATTHLPYAAAGFATGADPSFPVAGFELPPRVRLDPAVRTALDDWIDVAEQRYGLPVRSERAVPSW